MHCHLVLPFNLAFSFSMRINKTCWFIAFFHNSLKSTELSFLQLSVSEEPKKIRQ